MICFVASITEVFSMLMYKILWAMIIAFPKTQKIKDIRVSKAKKYLILGIKNTFSSYKIYIYLKL